MSCVTSWRIQTQSPESNVNILVRRIRKTKAFQEREQEGTFSDKAFTSERQVLVPHLLIQCPAPRGAETLPNLKINVAKAPGDCKEGWKLTARPQREGSSRSNCGNRLQSGVHFSGLRGIERRLSVLKGRDMGTET